MFRGTHGDKLHQHFFVACVGHVAHRLFKRNWSPSQCLPATTITHLQAVYKLLWFPSWLRSPIGPEKPIVYWPRSLKDVQHIYDNTRKDCLTVVLAVLPLRIVWNVTSPEYGPITIRFAVYWLAQMRLVTWALQSMLNWIWIWCRISR